MDEETTAFASKSMAEGEIPQMPSGMPYYRSLPHTWLNSISVKVFGADREFSYRLPSALFGILTIPLIFLLAKPFVGLPVSFLAALLIATSEWHIITSRQARMYAPFLFMYISCSFMILKWAKKDNFIYFALSSILFILAASFHNLGVFLAFIPLIVLFIKGYTYTPQWKLILFAVISGLTAYLYGELIVHSPYLDWKDSHGISSISINESNPYKLGSEFAYLAVIGCLGALLGAWLGVTSKVPDHDNGNGFRTLSRYSLSILFGCMATTGHLYGAVLSAFLLFILYQAPICDIIKQNYKPLLAISCIACVVAVFYLVELGLGAGARRLLTFPYPNWLLINEISSGITVLYLCLLVYLVINGSKSNNNIIAISILGIFPIILVGVLKKWAAARYLLVAYPFIVIAAVYSLHTSISYLKQRFFGNERIPVTIITTMICLSGVLGGHGIMHAYNAGTIDHGTAINRTALIFPFYPDHKYPGEFVSTHRREGDIIIAEDALEQRWYAGRIDYWLRKYGSDEGGRFLYKADDGQLHDIYVNSIVATVDILETITSDNSHRIWLITSAETVGKRNIYLGKEQKEWLDQFEAEHSPVYIGKDNYTKVFCINCDEPLFKD